MTDRRSPPLDVAGRLAAAARARSPTRASTRCSSRSCRTSATSPASPARPAMLLVTPDDALFVTDGRYTRAVGRAARRGGRRRRASRSGSPQAAQREVAARRPPPGRRGSGSRTTASRWAQQRDVRATGSPAPSSSPAERLVEDLRRVKDAGRGRPDPAACAIADDAFADAAPDARATGRPSASSRSRSSSRCASAARAATASIRSSRSGPTARSRTRGRRDRAIGRNELVVCDFGCIVDGYCSDMTRTVCVGDPGPDARHLYDTVLREPAGRARRGGRRRRVRRGRPGVPRRHRRRRLGRRVLARHRARCRSRDPRGAAGRGDRAVIPCSRRRRHRRAGVYLPGVGGVRIEDTVVVAADGPDALTEFPKDLVL